MVLYVFPPTATARIQIFDGSEWVNAVGTTDGAQEIYIKDSEVVTASGSVDAASNPGNVRLAFDIKGRKLVHWHVITDGAADLVVEVSPDGTTWYETPNRTSLSEAGEWDDWDFIGFRYVAVKCITANVGVTAIISAKL